MEVERLMTVMAQEVMMNTAEGCGKAHTEVYESETEEVMLDINVVVTERVTATIHRYESVGGDNLHRVLHYEWSQKRGAWRMIRIEN